MSLTTAGANASAAGVSAVAAYVSLHSADPGATGANETTAARQAASWTGSSGTRSLTGPLSFTGGAASGPVLYAGLWSAATGGTFYGSVPLSGDAAFTPSGTYTLTALSITST